MIRVFLYLYRVLSAHRLWAGVGLAVLVAVMALLALRMDYEEDIARFLPQSQEHVEYQQAVSQLAGQSRVVVCFTGSKDSVKQAMDTFAQHFATLDTAATVTDLRVTVDESQLLDVISFVSSHAPYYLTVADYRRMDSLLALPNYIGRQLAADKQLLMLPAGELAQPTLASDPLQLFTPVVSRLQAMGRNSRFAVDDGYMFTADGFHGLVFFTSPYGMSESGSNALLAQMTDQAASLTMADCPQVKVSAVGGPLVAVSNASQIKRDSMLAVTISVVLILALLVWHYRSLQYLWWIAASLGFGWLFALAGMSLLSHSISVIVLGMGSVIIGIAVNYPLHYLDHLLHTGNSLQALRDMVQPLLIGNITTVSAFLCLVWLDAAALRDLGLFGSFMLVGTILFVLVALPLWAKARPGSKVQVAITSKEGQREISALETVWQGGKKRLSLVAGRVGVRVLVPVGVLLTLILGYFGLKTSFDSDLRHINYMTPDQRQQLELLSTLTEEAPADLLGMVPTAAVQHQRLLLWQQFSSRHAGLADSLLSEARRQGFADQAFTPFLQLMSGGLQPQPAEFFSPVSRFLGGLHLVNATNVGAQLVEILQDSFNYVSFVCGFVVFAFLWLSFHRVELAMLAFLPLAVSWIWILGLMYLLGVQFNIVNIILATFIFGQGDDYTIFITEGLVYEHTTGRQRLQSYRRSVILSAAIMFIGIGTLIVARHPALCSLAQVTVIGMATVVVMAYYLPPVVFRWLVRHSRSQGVGDRLPVTLQRVAYSVFVMGFFLLTMYGFLLPYTWLYFRVGKVTEQRRLRYHCLLQRMATFAIRRVPGVSFYLHNRVGETFERPAVIVSNHQSHLDLMCLMMLTPRLVFLTNDWVWRNPFYGTVVHCAEYYPVSQGIEHHVEPLRSLYERGYSICVFPEGTRSDDCSILRFHKGAFYLAQQLRADIVPVCLHGVGHVLPKRDFLLRRGRIDVEVGHRVAASELPAANVGSTALLDFTRRMRHYYQRCYSSLCLRTETADYWLPFQRLADYYKVAVR